MSSLTKMKLIKGLKNLKNKKRSKNENLRKNIFCNVDIVKLGISFLLLNTKKPQFDFKKCLFESGMRLKKQFSSLKSYLNRCCIYFINVYILILAFD